MNKSHAGVPSEAELTHTLRELSQRIAKEAQQGLQGNAPAFARLQTSREEFAQLVRIYRGDLFLIGILLSLLLYVPLFNLAVPVLAGLAFTQFSLGRLSELRRADS